MTWEIVAGAKEEGCVVQQLTNWIHFSDMVYKISSSNIHSYLDEVVVKQRKGEGGGVIVKAIPLCKHMQSIAHYLSIGRSLLEYSACVL